MKAKNGTRVFAFVVAFLCALPGLAEEGRHAERQGDDDKNTEVAHTISWWCLDMNRLWRTDLTVIAGAGVLLIPPDPPAVPVCSSTSFPVTVPNGSRFVPGTGIWWTNKTYPRLVREGLAAMGYEFVSNSPHEDLIRKVDEVVVEVLTFPGNVLVATYSLEPRRNARGVTYGDVYSAFRAFEVPLIIPELGIDISVAEYERLPVAFFPVAVGPVAPGNYRAWLYWNLTAAHNDGMGLDPDVNFLGPGLVARATARFVVSP